LHFLDPFSGDALDVLFPAGHERQGPCRMAFVFSTMTSGLPTAGVAED
jgi:hypothetical protein